jgi:hypothetical protein
MFRTRAIALNTHLTPRAAATTQPVRTPSAHLCQRWTLRNGHLTARWKREPHDLEGHAPMLSHVAA